MSKVLTQQVEKLGIMIEKILSPKNKGEKRQPNFGKKRRKQSGGFAYKLRKSYTQSSTTEFRRTSSKNEGARKFCEVTNESVLIRRLVQRYTRVSIYLKGKLTRVASNIAKIAKNKCEKHQKGPKMKVNDLDHGKSPENLGKTQSATKNEGAVSSPNNPVNKTVLSVNPEGRVGTFRKSFNDLRFAARKYWKSSAGDTENSNTSDTELLLSNCKDPIFEYYSGNSTSTSCTGTDKGFQVSATCSTIECMGTCKGAGDIPRFGGCIDPTRRVLECMSTSRERGTIPGIDTMYFDTDSYQVKVDTGCSVSLSGVKTDFVPGTMREAPSGLSIQSYGGTRVPVTHMGTIRWYVNENDNVTRELLLPRSLYVPSTETRLLSPQHLAQSVDKTNVPEASRTKTTTYSNHILLQWTKDKYKKTVDLDKNNIGTMYTAPGYNNAHAFCAKVELELPISEPSETTSTFTQSLCMPPGYGFLSYDATAVNITKDNQQTAVFDKGSIMELAEKLRSTGVLADFEKKMFKDTTQNPQDFEETYADIRKNEDLLLLLHQKYGHISMKRLQRMAKLGMLPTRVKDCPIPICQSCLYGKMTRRQWRTKQPANKATSKVVTMPGEIVSVDQLESPVGGFIAQMKGKLYQQHRYRCATVFVDHFSGLSFVYLQQSTTAEETLKAKEAFENYAATYGVKIIHYHADNGRFAERIWKEDVERKVQALTFSGVGAHHQNGRAEKRIRDLQDQARTSLIHANRLWPDAISVELWPYALRHANDCFNLTAFPSETETPIEKFSKTKIMPDFKQVHPFGCPSYALDGRIQSGKKAGKWDVRARAAIYIGPSPQHARTVGLLLSLTTGLVSPQFHVKYDESFSTLRNNSLPKSAWQQLAGFVTKSSQNTSQQVETTVIPVGENNEVTRDTVVPVTNNDQDSGSVQGNNDGGSIIDDLSVHPGDETYDTDSDNESHTSRPPQRTTRAGIATRRPGYLKDYVTRSAVCEPISGYFDDYVAIPAIIEHFTHENPSCYAASSDPDVLYLKEAMKADDSEQFLLAMQDEVNAHVRDKNWMLVHKSIVPSNRKILPAVWAFRRKRDIATRVVKKWKARLNVHGGKQIKGLDYWKTYAPVASWPSIRLIMYAAVLNNWSTRQVDFVLAFPQAPCETDIYMQIPQGFSIDGGSRDYCLKLINNLYGQKQAGRVWNSFLVKGLVEIGFVQSETDPCVFWRGQVILVIYTDDTIVTGPDDSEVAQAVDDIGKKFNITKQEVVDDFLGVKITRDRVTGTITLTQPQLIDSILEDLCLDDKSNGRKLPAAPTKLLQKFTDSEPYDESFHYRSVIGKLNYLEKSTRPDIAYAVHQCARFSSEPKIEHTKAVKLIGRYLKLTRDKGIICTPKEESLHCYADAGFAGDWDPEIAEHDNSTARSRSGHIITYAGCPLVWASKMQTEIALSTTESEYIALSTALREIIPLMRLIKELKAAGFNLPCNTPEVHCKAFEDNSGALEMARSPKIRPRTKHLNIKYHHFREAVEAGDISVHAVGTADQWADIFTKPLSGVLFDRFRQAIMGWNISETDSNMNIPEGVYK